MAKKRAGSGAGLPATTTTTRKLTLQQHESQVKATLDEIGPDVWEIYVEAKQRLAHAVLAHVEYYWQTGRRFMQLNNDYGVKAVTAVADALQIDKRTVQEAMRLVQVYPKNSDVNEILEQQGPSGQTLTWSHLRLIISENIKDADRPGWITRCLKEQWSPDELSRYFQLVMGDERGGRGGGRPFTAPRSISHMLSKVDHMGGVWIKYCDEFAGKFEVVSELISNTPADTVKPETLTQLTQVEAQLARMRSMTDQLTANFRTVRSHIESSLGNNTPEANGESPANEETPAADAPAGKASKGKKGAKAPAKKAAAGKGGKGTKGPAKKAAAAKGKNTTAAKSKKTAEPEAAPAAEEPVVDATEPKPRQKKRSDISE